MQDNNTIDLDGKVYIKEGKIFVINPKENGKPAVITPSKGLKLMVDKEEVTFKKEVFANSEIEVFFPSTLGKRNLNISLSLDKMKAYMDISYEPKLIYTLRDEEEDKIVNLKYEVLDKELPPKFSREEIEKVLLDKGILYGILRNNIEKCIKEEYVKDCIIATGKKPVDGTDDTIKLNFIVQKSFKEDSKGNIDYKSIGNIQYVKSGDVIATIIKGKEGIDGVNVFGKIVKSKKRNMVKVKCSSGCELKGDSIIAIIDGKPMYKRNTFKVNHVHEVKGNVDLSTGNINFSGSVIVYGAVSDGMKIESGAGIEVYKNVSGSEIISKGNISVGGNIIYSKVICGGEDNVNIKVNEDLTLLSNILREIRLTMEKIINKNLLGKDVKPGEIIKVLIENKFKNVPVIITSIEKSYAKKGTYKNFINILKKGLLGLGTLSIESSEDIMYMEKLLKEEIEIIKDEKINFSDVDFRYAQNSIIQSSGDIYITGKGEYITNIDANGSIYFTGINSVARGGILKAKNEIKCMYVGSDAGVSTKLKVEREGKIWAKVAFQNTRFAVGTLEHIIEYPCKDVHAYLDEKGELVVEKLKL
ncbi:DUF342 domain-containing protein [Hathewaya histolytica]|uniref:DUF342 domain-containing protein n=1 Tax=Hathewaya histolytica TaxID=1498 RepID=UPI003B6703D5